MHLLAYSDRTVHTLIGIIVIIGIALVALTICAVLRARKEMKSDDGYNHH